MHDAILPQLRTVGMWLVPCTSSRAALPVTLALSSPPDAKPFLTSLRAPSQPRQYAQIPLHHETAPYDAHLLNEAVYHLAVSVHAAQAILENQRFKRLIKIGYSA